MKGPVGLSLSRMYVVKLACVCGLLLGVEIQVKYFFSAGVQVCERELQHEQQRKQQQVSSTSLASILITCVVTPVLFGQDRIGLAAATLFTQPASAPQNS